MLSATTTELEALERECETAYKEVEALLEYTSIQAIELERSQNSFGHFCGAISRFGATFETGTDSSVRDAFLLRLMRERIAFLQFLKDEFRDGGLMFHLKAAVKVQN